MATDTAAYTTGNGSPPPSRWRLREIDERLAEHLAQALKLHPAVARVLAARGWEPGDACGAFLQPRLDTLRDPFELHDMERAADSTLAALRANQKIAVFGDYDVDGVCSAAILVLTLRRLGTDPEVFIPHRIKDGYGMSVERVEELAASGVRFLLTVDTGITAIEPIRRANELGMTVVVTDHHLPEHTLPDAAAIVNPNRGDAFYEHARLCGAGVAFKFAHALLKKSGQDPAASREFLKGMLDLVALATVADVVPLVGENRTLTHHGLRQLAKEPRPGIAALLSANGLEGKRLTPHHVAFVLAPRLNAAGRTDHAGTAFELLLSESAGEARRLALELNRLNDARRDKESHILDHALEAAEEQMRAGLDSLLLVAGEDYHLGVVGIVAARLVERFHRPSVVLRLDEDVARGSARSIPGFDIHEALNACADLLVEFGGHHAAAGLQVAPDRIDPLRKALNVHAQGIFETRDLQPEIDVDARISPAEIDWRFFRDLQRLEPFGEDNPPPVFLLEGARSRHGPRIVGRGHLKLLLECGGKTFSGIGFRLGHLMTVCESSRHPFDLLFRPIENTWRGRQSLELEIQDIRPCSA